MQWWLCASPAWVAAHGMPQHPAPLASARWVGMLLGSSTNLPSLQVMASAGRTGMGTPGLGAAHTAAQSTAPSSHQAAVHAELQNHSTGERYSLQVLPHIVSNNQVSVQQMCEAGLGVALLGSMDVADAVAAGTLVRLLSDWACGELDIWTVTPQRHAQPAKVRQAISTLHAYLARLPGLVNLAPLQEKVTP